MSEKKEVAKLSPVLEGKFQAVGVEPGLIVSKKFGDVDLRYITLEKAEALVNGGFKYLRKLEKPATADKK